MSARMSSDTNALNFFQIPVNDITRATTFYESIFEIQMIPGEMTGGKMSFFPIPPSGGKVGGALVQSEMLSPSKTGTTVFLNANPDLQLVLDRITANGGTIVNPKTLINPETGYFAFFIDTEGNFVGLHSNL